MGIIDEIVTEVVDAFKDKNELGKQIDEQVNDMMGKCFCMKNFMEFLFILFDSIF